MRERVSYYALQRYTGAAERRSGKSTATDRLSLDLRDSREALRVAVEAIKDMRLEMGSLGGLDDAEKGDTGFDALKRIASLVDLGGAP